MALADAAGFVLLVPGSFLLSLVAAAWLVVPAFVLGGWYHERARASDRRTTENVASS